MVSETKESRAVRQWEREAVRQYGSEIKGIATVGHVTIGQLDSDAMTQWGLGERDSGQKGTETVGKC